MLFNNKKSVYTARRSELNIKFRQQVKLLMIVYDEKINYTAIKNISRLLSSLNAKKASKRAYQNCMNCLNSFRTKSTRDEHHGYCSTNGHVRDKVPSEKEK